MHERSPRFALKFQVVYDDGETFMAGPVVNISESGMFLETVMPLEPGKEVRLTPLLPEQDGVWEIEGVVVRKADYDLDNAFDRTPGMGIRFKDVSSENLAQIRRLIASKGKKREG
jgi:uncharacterized protein (TIGR02266 family)